MRLRRSNDFLARMQSAGNPERLEVRHRATAADVAQGFFPAIHRAKIGNAYFFHGRTGDAAVQRVVVRV